MKSIHYLTLFVAAFLSISTRAVAKDLWVSLVDRRGIMSFLTSSSVARNPRSADRLRTKRPALTSYKR